MKYTSILFHTWSPDDLDMIIGTANLDTVYIAVTEQFNFSDHYKIKKEKMLQ